MRISTRDIHRKRQALGQEPPNPSYGPSTEMNDPIEAELEGIRDRSDEAAKTDSESRRKQAGTNFKNQYR